MLSSSMAFCRGEGSNLHSSHPKLKLNHFNGHGTGYIGLISSANFLFCPTLSRV